MNLVDDRLRGIDVFFLHIVLMQNRLFILVRLLIQFINGILTGPMSRNSSAYHILKESITHNCHLRNDELTAILECIFRHLNRDDDGTNFNETLSQTGIKVIKEY